MRDDISIHALREEGDRKRLFDGRYRGHFYPRPPRGGRQPGQRWSVHDCMISIHALREEGDGYNDGSYLTQKGFLSTPSARRATHVDLCGLPIAVFLSTPSARRATGSCSLSSGASFISIHALREEGDCCLPALLSWLAYFYPRPPRGGRLATEVTVLKLMNFYPRPPRGGRHAHSLILPSLSDFYPRPPRGGRPKRRTCFSVPSHFYPRPPRGGRPPRTPSASPSSRFLSTPSARRATAKTETKSLFSNKLYNILHEFRRALIYNGSKNYPNHAK